MMNKTTLCLSLFLGYLSIDLFDKVYEDKINDSFSDILLLKNKPYIVSEKSYPSLINEPIYPGVESESLYQYGHLYSKKFKCMTANVNKDNHLTLLMKTSLDSLEHDISVSMAVLQSVFFLASLYTDTTPPIITNKLKKQGVVPYDL